MATTRRKGGKWKWGILFTSIALFMAYIVIQYLIFGPQKAGAVSSKLKDAAFPYKPWIYILYVHIAAGSVAFVTGPFQFLKKPVGKRAKLHRKLGYAYVGAIVVATIAGVYLCYYATGGPVAGFGFLTLDILWITSTLTALRKVIRKQFAAHQHWMLRSYAITFAFVSFRVIVLLFTLAGLSIHTAMQVSAWICSMFNLVMAEWMIRRKGAPKWQPNIMSSSH